MSAPNPPHQSLAVDQASPIVREDPGLMDSDSGSHSQDSSLSTDGPSTPKDENFADRADEVAITDVADTVIAKNEPELKSKGDLVELEDDGEEEDDDDDDDFIPRGGQTRPTATGASTGPKGPIRVGR